MSKRRSAEYEDINDYDVEPFFELLDLYFEQDKHMLVRHHTESFNQFIDAVIPSIIQAEPYVITEKADANKLVRYKLSFEDLAIIPPMLENDKTPMFPLDAIQLSLSYSSKYTATVTQWQEVVDLKTKATVTRMIDQPERDVPIARIPIMVGSKYCNLNLNPSLRGKHSKYDQGGYFIINGNEKVVMSIETIVPRKPLVMTKKEQNLVTYMVKVYSRDAEKYVGNMQVFGISMKKDENLILVYPRFKENSISIFTLIRALGLVSDEDIVDCILDVEREPEMLNQLNVCLRGGQSVTTQEEAMEVLSNNLRSVKVYTETDPEIKAQQKKDFVTQILSESVLPHVYSGSGNRELDMLYKAFYICYMIRKLLKCYLKRSKESVKAACDDRDSMMNKRIETTGVLLGTLFEQFFKRSMGELGKTFQSKNTDDINPINIINHIKPNSIEQGLRNALVTGKFGPNAKKGYSQMLNRLNHLHSASYMRRVISPTVDPATNKMTSPRNLHNTQWDVMDPAEVPEGPKTGLVKNMTLITNITMNMNNQIPILLDYLRPNIIALEDINKKTLFNHVKVFLNGNWIGICENIIKVHNDLREMRFVGQIDRMVGIYLDYATKELHLHTDSGRMIRPYLTVSNNKLNFEPSMLEGIGSWAELLVKFPRIIEYTDKDEEQNMMLSITPQYLQQSSRIMNLKAPISPSEINVINRTNRYDNHVFTLYTHCEIHPCMILGLITSNTPYVDHNQAPRLIFRYNQLRQAMGLYMSDYRERFDISYILYHPQIPLVASRASKYTGSHILPCGENAAVAIASWTGYNQEDSSIINKSAIDKGFMRAQALKKYNKEIEKSQSSVQTSIFMKPDRNKVDGLKDLSANYDKLTEQGYCKVETQIENGDVIIGMVNPNNLIRDDDKPYKDASTIYKSLVPGTIDRVLTGVNSDSYPMIKIRVRSERIPQIGDKFACYDNQTEVLTNEGWIYFRKLTMDHQVATLKEDRLVYEKPLEIMTYPCQDQKMYRINSDHIDCLVTPNHRMWVREMYQENYRLKEVRSLKEKMYIYRKNAHSYAQTRPNSNLTENEFIKPDGTKIPLNQWLKRMSGWIKENQWLPEWVWDLNQSQAEQFVQAIGEEYCTESERLADQLQILYFHAGISMGINKVENKYYLTRIKDESYVPAIKGHLDVELYSGNVHCCRVNSGVIYVRRNKKAFWCGNSSNAQKSTLGIRLHRSDLPYTTEGIVPDIIINPNCMPKRMTIGQLIECHVSKVCAIKGIYGDATPFIGVDLHKFNDQLVELGYEPWSNDTMYNGMTGEKIAVRIFFGPTYYSRLKQMVSDKVHSRARGPSQLLTRAPPEGRARDGGLRIGEMEKDAICAHGAAQFLKEKMVDNSDIYTCHVCDLCGLIAHRVPNRKYYTCRSCNNTTKISKIVIPYAFKLALQELRSINILGRIITPNSIPLVGAENRF